MSNDNCNHILPFKAEEYINEVLLKQVCRKKNSSFSLGRQSFESLLTQDTNNAIMIPNLVASSKKIKKSQENSLKSSRKGNTIKKRQIIAKKSKISAIKDNIKAINTNPKIHDGKIDQISPMNSILNQELNKEMLELEGSLENLRKAALKDISETASINCTSDKYKFLETKELEFKLQDIFDRCSTQTYSYKASPKKRQLKDKLGTQSVQKDTNIRKAINNKRRSNSIGFFQNEIINKKLIRLFDYYSISSHNRNDEAPNSISHNEDSMCP